MMEVERLLYKDPSRKRLLRRKPPQGVLCRSMFFVPLSVPVCLILLVAPRVYPSQGFPPCPSASLNASTDSFNVNRKCSGAPGQLFGALVRVLLGTARRVRKKVLGVAGLGGGGTCGAWR